MRILEPFLFRFFIFPQEENLKKSQNSNMVKMVMVKNVFIDSRVRID